MQFAILSLLIFVSSLASASGNFIFTCAPSASGAPNGLKIAKLILDMNEDTSTAVATVDYLDSTTAKLIQQMDYHATITTFIFSHPLPSQNDLNIFIENTGGGWTAYVGQKAMPTFSQLNCY
jgi:hypothetical protein